ncbi:type III secretion protein [Pseudomonas vanderleydeniana]|uniref:Type III secretion protein n=1 Tax=Pseudomonas vanderleydeniana TaxID=2745495 RepID=A0A9E6PRD0_9PSED|nr:type III secretion protein [Pseudomonas vanderleydeniana]QXI31264.1 type III secretion protein [Pseudomonas vanderleydeniana]
MSHSDTDALAPANDPLLSDLAPTLDLLAPIRRHRLTMAEQAWQRQRSVLDALRTRLAQMTTELQQLRDNQRQARAQQHEQHANRRLPLHEMNQWLAGEQQALRQIERFEQNLRTLQEEYRQQQHWTDDSQRQLRRHQRDMEKLDYLRELSREAS